MQSRQCRKKLLDLWSVVALIGLFISAAVGHAATFYVAANGNDTNPGTEARPFRKLAKGVKALKAGDTLIVKAGTYKENLENIIPSGTSWDTPVKVQAATGETVIITPESSGGIVLSFLKEETKYIIIDGFIIDANRIGGYAVYIGGGAHHIRIINCEIKNALRSGIIASAGGVGTSGGCCHEFKNLDIHDNGTDGKTHGIYIATTKNVIENSRIYRNAGYGVHIYNSHGGAVENIVRYNKIYDNNVHGGPIGMILADGGNIAHSNVIWGNKSGISAGSKAKIYNNTIYKNNKAGGEGAGIILLKADVEIKNNIIYNNGSRSAIHGIGSKTIQKNNLIEVDPKFTSASNGDVALQADSPAIDAGVVIGEVSHDFAGVSRPQGAGYDIGAYEYTATKLLLLPKNLRVTGGSIQ